MAYNDDVMRRFDKPQRVGSLDPKSRNVGTGLVGAPSCGDVMKLQVEINNGIITKARFKTFGCVAVMASSDYAAELIEGKTADEARDVRNTDIASALNLPPVKIHCSLLAEDAIKAALHDYYNKQSDDSDDEQSDDSDSSDSGADDKIVDNTDKLNINAHSSEEDAINSDNKNSYV